MGAPGALANNGCCNAFVGVLPAGHEINNEAQDAVSNSVSRP
jgi:hypothetical protein